MEQITTFVQNNQQLILGLASTLVLGLFSGAFLTRKKLFVRNIGDSIVALSDLMDGATADELKNFKDEIIETINLAKSTK
jgi:hypothetical protein